LTRRKASGDYIRIGKMQLIMDNISSFETRLRAPFTSITGTPIIMRISNERYQKYNIETKYPYAYICWRKEYPLETFIRQLEENLRAKYGEFISQGVTRDNDPPIGHL
jgi:CRISPR-associated endoribonuclease Cas6